MSIISIQPKSAVTILLRALGWCDQCQLPYHNWCCVWSSWWNTESCAACCCTGCMQVDSVNFASFVAAIELLTCHTGSFHFLA